MHAVWKNRKTGRLVDAEDNGEEFRFTSQGGGFVYRMEASRFRSEHSLSSLPTEYRPGWFAIDGGRVYRGYTTGVKWNGWACPTFPLRTAFEVLSDSGYQYDSEPINGFVSVWLDSDPDYEPWAEGVEIVHGQECLPIGAGSWIWDEFTPDEVARRFLEQLGNCLTEEELAEVVIRNRTSGNSCATHDFCDANMLMANAMGVMCEPCRDDYSSLFNAAWSLARVMLEEEFAE